MAHKVAIITEAQKNELLGKNYAPDVLFNPIKDNNNNWVISEEEVNFNESQFSWVNDLPLIDYEPIPTTSII